MMFTINPNLFLIIPAVLAWFAQGRVRKVYQEYRKIPNRRRVSGLDVARHLLSYYGLTSVTLEQTPGQLTDHYNPMTRRLHLSNDTVSSNSITSMGIVAHEVGHAVQDAEGYTLMRFRNRLARPVTLLAQLSPLVYIGGMWFGISSLLALGGLMLVSQAVFAVVTLPVERNASTRAVAMLERTGLASPEECQGVRKVLQAAAFTYLAALGRHFASFLFFVGVVGIARGG